MSTQKLNILIADDHPLFREALTYIVEASFSSLKGNPEVIIHQTVDYDATLDLLASQTIDWLFLDLNMPGSNGLSGLTSVSQQFPDLSIIVISANESKEIIQSCFTHNIQGYITKSMQPSDIEKAIHTILAGERFSPLQHDDISNDQNLSGLELLTTAQLNILTHIGIGKLNKQIAIDLGITEATVKAHITQIYKKLHVNNRTQAALIAQQAQLVD